jgi:hypothetical protein
MISKGDLITELLQLVDNTQLTEIELYPIIEKYSIGLDFNEQKTFRNNLDSAIHELELNGYITKHNLNFSASSGGIWFSSSGSITGTLKRKEKKEQENNSGALIQKIENNYGLASQNSDLKYLQADFQPITNPPIVQKTEQAKQGIISSIGMWILTNIVAVIISGLILALIIYKLGWN